MSNILFEWKIIPVFITLLEEKKTEPLDYLTPHWSRATGHWNQTVTILRTLTQIQALHLHLYRRKPTQQFLLCNWIRGRGRISLLACAIIGRRGRRDCRPGCGWKEEEGGHKVGVLRRIRRAGSRAGGLAGALAAPRDVCPMRRDKGELSSICCARLPFFSTGSLVTFFPSILSITMCIT